MSELERLCKLLVRLCPILNAVPVTMWKPKDDDEAEERDEWRRRPYDCWKVEVRGEFGGNIVDARGATPEEAVRGAIQQVVERRVKAAQEADRDAMRARTAANDAEAILVEMNAGA